MKAQEFNDGRRAHTTKLAVTAMSAMAAETVTFPIDLIKTRLQLHGESLVSSRRTSAVRVVSEILRNDGVLGLYKGLSPAIIRHMFYTPIRIVNYEFLRNFLVPADHTLSLSSKAIIGGISGVIAQVVANPADLVRVRMQADSRMIIRTEGVRGLWKGVLPNIQRAFLVNMGELACYDHAKRFVIDNNIANDNIYAHTLSSIMSGLSATTLSCPADVIKTRMMNQAADKQGNCKYSNSYDCLVKTVKVEGLKALWKGFFPTWARLGPWQFVFWVSYEKFRQIAGLSSF
ncbi:hypothetical protein KY290_024167 [Solanum tuberosum]|uniref:Mitochondrial uncoupling protein 3 n=1 Tax=Solanum tuberosum TaxID=4113 RepID=A0ABQ7UPW9_SOLTU|nr:hypothetical protein KY290_024167 [Solanum tuberosum]